MLNINIPYKPQYNYLYGIDEKFRNEIAYIDKVTIVPKDDSSINVVCDESSPVCQVSSNEYKQYLQKTKQYTRREALLNTCIRIKEFFKKHLRISDFFMYFVYLIPFGAALLAINSLVFLFDINLFLVLPKYVLIIIFLLPTEYGILKYLSFSIIWIIIEILVNVLQNELDNEIIKKKAIHGSLISRKAAIVLLQSRENKRLSEEIKRYEAELSKLEIKHPGLKDSNYHVPTYSENVFIKESAGFIKELILIINECNARQKKRWWMDLNPELFEKEVAKWFIQKGYSATITKYNGDGGVDIILKKDGVTEFVQCKHYKDQNVPVATVRELFGVMASEKVTKGYIVSICGLTQGATEFASKNNIKSVTINDLSKNTIIQDYKTDIKQYNYFDKNYNKQIAGFYVGDCFIYGDIFDNKVDAERELPNKVQKDRWGFILSLYETVEHVHYYVIVSCPLSMKEELQKSSKIKIS